MITIIDYGAGNIKSIQNMLKKIGVQSRFTNAKEDIMNAEKLILPGVGHFDYGMKQLGKSGLIKVLEQRVIQDEVPILGICLGSQMLGLSSEEGNEPGLGWIDMNIVRFDKKRMKESTKVPNMGWNNIKPAKNSILLNGLESNSRFYFVHSYHMKLNRSEDALTYSYYDYNFVSAVSFKNIYGVQFHPEKSHKYGMQLLKNFATL